MGIHHNTVRRLSTHMGLLDLIAKVWGQNSWDELTFSEKSLTIFLIFDLAIISPIIILDFFDEWGLI